jgi:hypothetical protein
MCAESLGSNLVIKVLHEDSQTIMNYYMAINLDHVGQIGAMHAFLRSNSWRLGTTAIPCACHAKSA